MLIAARNAMMVKSLPYDAEIEYLESTGTQYIDTGVICDQDTDIVFSGRTRTVSTATSFFFGARTAFRQNAFTACLANTPPIQIQVGFGSFDGQTYLPGIPSNSDFIISNSGTTWSLAVGGQTSRITAATSAFTTPTTMLLFRMSNNGTPDDRSFNGAIYSVKLYQNGVLVRDFIPVRKGTVGYLYDRVSGKLFGNAGTGDFVLGQDVVPVEYIESHGTEWIDTGVKADLPLQLEADIDFTNPNTGTNVQCLCGGYSGSARFWIASLPQGKLNCGLTNNAISAANVPVGQKASLNVVFENGRQTGTIDGVQFVSASNTTSNYWFRNYNLRIFHMFGPFIGNNNRPLQAKLYGCRLFINSSAPVRSFRPVRVGTDATSWEGAMMDVLTRRVYRNAGTGAFVIGSDK